jgi:hypothetical protein
MPAQNFPSIIIISSFIIYSVAELGYSLKREHTIKEMDEHPQEVLINNVNRDSIIAELKSMISSPAYMTKAPYHSHEELSFIEHHLRYLKGHPSLDPNHYLSNLKLMLKKRT